MYFRQLFCILSIFIYLQTAATSYAGIPTGPPPEPITYSVHAFDCEDCHNDQMSLKGDVADVFCLRCHKIGANPVAPPPHGWPPITRDDGITPWHDGLTEVHFTGDDASNAFGNSSGATLQTSHNWVAADRLPRAGASAPVDARFYSNYGTSLDRITCSRCHLPHDDTDNPKLLALGADSVDEMCLDCHRSWNQSGNHGWLTHPIVADYNAAVVANPDKYRASISNKGKAGVQKVNGGVSCTSCHSIHFADSDASTMDGPYNTSELLSSRGRLLRGDGSERDDKSSLCRSCHTYQEHGDDSGEKVGCLVCHSGHSYDASSPNYYVLRKSTKTSTYNTVSGLDYSDSKALIPNEKHTLWHDQNNGTANGYCEGCHGDISTYPGSVHTSDAICTDCHTHNPSGAGSFGHGGGGTGCEECHGHDAGYEYEPGKFNQGKGSFQSHSTHTEMDEDDVRGPDLTCGICHDTKSYPAFRTGSDENGDGRITLSETTICDDCHNKRGIIDGVNDPVIGAKINWSSGIYENNRPKAAQKKWCIGCHGHNYSYTAYADINRDSNNRAGLISGDDSTYGFYVTGHGRNGQVDCYHCHDLSSPHYHFNYSTADQTDVTKRFYEGLGVQIPYVNHSYASFPLCLSCHTMNPTNFLQRPDDVPGGWGDLHWMHTITMNTNTDGSCLRCHGVHGNSSSSANAYKMGPLAPLRLGDSTNNPGENDSLYYQLNDQLAWNDPAINKGGAFKDTSCPSCHAIAGYPNITTGIGPTDTSTFNNWYLRNYQAIVHPVEFDNDSDTIANDIDNCVSTANQPQLDDDGDGIGNVCDVCPDDPLNDPDSDGICSALDNCPSVNNPLQSSSDDDADGIPNECDNCLSDYNPDQADADQDGLGDACDLTCAEDDSPLWTKVFTPPGSYDRYPDHMAMDSANNIYIVGHSNYYKDGWFYKFSSDGTQLMKENVATSFATNFSPYGSNSRAIAVDGQDNVYITGNAYVDVDDDGHPNGSGSDIYLLKYGHDEQKQWTRMFTPGTGGSGIPSGLAADQDGNVYIAGYTSGDLDGGGNRGGNDIFLLKYLPDGTLDWVKQVGTSASDSNAAVTIDQSGNIYLYGSTSGYLGDDPAGINTGGSDLIILRYNPDGTQQWAKQIGSTANDSSVDIATDNDNGIYLLASTAGMLDGITDPGTSSDVAVIKLDQNGAHQWTTQVGLYDSYDSATGIAVDADQNIYVSGLIEGYMMLGLHKSGSKLFNKSFFQTVSSTPTNRITDVAIDSYGDIYVIGYPGQTFSYYRNGLLMKSEMFCPCGEFNTDSDGDGILDPCDNCPSTSNPDQSDLDGDLTGDSCDVCPADPLNDEDQDGLCVGSGFATPQTGDNDSCPVDTDNDSDNDNLCAGSGYLAPKIGGNDPCPADPDNDADGDGFCVDIGYQGSQIGDQDNCPVDSNFDQLDSDCNGTGDACAPSYFFYPENFTVTPRSFITDMDISWGDKMGGEYGYHVEHKAEACGLDNLNFEPVTTIYRHDTFSNGLDESGWVAGAQIQAASDYTMPATVTNDTGSASVSWNNGKVTLHSVTTGLGYNGYNVSYIAPKDFANVIGDGDFDIQFDFNLPNGLITADQYFSYVRYDMYLPDTNGKQNSMFVGRMRDGFVFNAKVEGVQQSDTVVTGALSGTLRMVRSNRTLAGYYWDGTDWILIHRHSLPLTADLKPGWTGLVQHANRKELGGQDITVEVDNFKLKTIGGTPQPLMNLTMNETSWSGAVNEVRDQGTDNHHGTAKNGANTSFDVTRGTVGDFDGIDDHIEVIGTGSLDTATDGSFTFAAWAKPETRPPANDANDNRYAIISRPGWHTDLHYDSTKSYRFEIWNHLDDNFYVATPLYNTGTWHHLVGVADDAAKEIHLYVDNTHFGPVSYTGDLRSYSAVPYFIGAANTGGYNWFFDGQIDDAQIFNRALTTNEVDALYNNRLSIVDSGLDTGKTHCYRVYPFKNDSCLNWSEHKSVEEVIIATNSAPTAPSNLTPADGDNTLTDRYPVLTASAFSDADGGDTLSGSAWRISTANGSDFVDNVVYLNYSGAGVTSHTVTQPLLRDVTYYWQVAYYDSKGELSDYSTETSFLIPNTPPNTPTNTTPASGAVRINLNPELTASAFSDPDSIDPHHASEWQISTVSGAGFDTGIEYFSGSQLGQNSHVVTAPLTANTTYYWRVRYQDDSGAWSGWSTETPFTTLAILPGTISYWGFDEGSGGTAFDYTGANTANLVVAPNNPTWTVDSIYGNALYFDGYGDEVYWLYNGGVPANTFTLEANVKTLTSHGIDAESQTGIGGTSGQRYLFWPNYPGDSTHRLYPGDRFVDAGLGVSVGDNGISVYEHGSSYMPAHAVYSAALGNDWNHIVVVIDNKTPYIYLNGVLVHTGIQSTRNNIYAPIRLGYGQYGHFEGTVDEVVIYDRALNATDVKTRCEDARGVGQCE